MIAGGRELDAGEMQAPRRTPGRAASSRSPRCLPRRRCARASRCAGTSQSIADERERWRTEARLVEYLHRFGLDEARTPETLLRRRAQARGAGARLRDVEPDLLLLDEPTNHLDIEAIAQLEELVRKLPAAIVITHDRAFLDRVATRIVELDRGLLRSYPGNFAAYHARRSDELAPRRSRSRKFDKFWAQEEAWIRKGIEARRTRNEGRVRRLEALRARAHRAAQPAGQRQAVRCDAGERSGKLVAELDERQQALRRPADRARPYHAESCAATGWG